MSLKTPARRLILIIFSILLTAAAACKNREQRKDVKRARARLRNVTSVTIHYLPPVKDKTKKTTVTLARPGQIAALISKMRFRKVSPCQCKHKYRLEFKIKDETTVTVFSYIDGWNFAGKKAAQRAPGDLMEHIDQLFGIPRGQHYLE